MADDWDQMDHLHQLVVSAASQGPASSLLAPLSKTKALTYVTFVTLMHIETGFFLVPANLYTVKKG